MVAVVPSTHRLELGSLQRIGRKTPWACYRTRGWRDVRLQTGGGSSRWRAYGLTVVLDDALIDAQDIWFEGGDHESLIHLDAGAFKKLMKNAEHGDFSHHV